MQMKGAEHSARVAKEKAEAKWKEQSQLLENDNGRVKRALYPIDIVISLLPHRRKLYISNPSEMLIHSEKKKMAITFEFYATTHFVSIFLEN